MVFTDLEMKQGRYIALTARRVRHAERNQNYKKIHETCYDDLTSIEKLLSEILHHYGVHRRQYDFRSPVMAAIAYAATGVRWVVPGQRDGARAKTQHLKTLLFIVADHMNPRLNTRPREEIEARLNNLNKEIVDGPNCFRKKFIRDFADVIGIRLAPLHTREVGLGLGLELKAIGDDRTKSMPPVKCNQKCRTRAPVAPPPPPSYDEIELTQVTATPITIFYDVSLTQKSNCPLATAEEVVVVKPVTSHDDAMPQKRLSTKGRGPTSVQFSWPAAPSHDIDIAAASQMVGPLVKCMERVHG